MIGLKEKWFIPPAIESLTGSGGLYQGKFASYSHYNYLRPTMFSRLKRQRLEVALNAVADHFGQANAIELGCADGVLLPSLARYFRQVAAIDVNQDLLQRAQRLVRHHDLANVSLTNSRDLSFEELREVLGAVEYQVLFLLETLEHVGSAQQMYESRMTFLRGAASLLTWPAVMVVTVPVMVGLPFAAKYIVQSAARMPHERHTLAEFWRAAVLRKTDSMEATWSHGHKGFNHLKMEAALGEHFRIREKQNLLVSMCYILEPLGGAGLLSSAQT